MDYLTALGHAAAIAFSVSLALSGFMIYAGMGDVPVSRSSHQQTIPTSGGLGIMAAIGAGVLCLGLFYPYFLGDGPLLGQVLSIGMAVAFVGLADDIYGGNALFKMGLLMGLSALLVWTIDPVVTLPLTDLKVITLPYWAGFAGSALWVFVVMNVVNFMDGANGMMGLTLGIAFIAMALIGGLLSAPMTVCLSALMAAGLLGFLPYNFRAKARIFSGDVGSLFAGFLFAAAALLLVTEAETRNLVYVGPILILPFLTDVFLTLLRRARRKDNLLAAHNQHLYQRIIQAGRGHRMTSVIYGLATLLCALIAIVWTVSRRIESILSLAVLVGLAVVIYVDRIMRLKKAS